MTGEIGLHLLVCCKHPDILDTLLRIINQKTVHTAEGCMCIDNFHVIFSHTKAEVVLIGSGFTEEEEGMIQSHVQQLKPGTPLIFHYGGGSGLLHAEIRSALARYETNSIR